MMSTFSNHNSTMWSGVWYHFPEWEHNSGVEFGCKCIVGCWILLYQNIVIHNQFCSMDSPMIKYVEYGTLNKK